MKTAIWIWCISMMIVPTLVTPLNISEGTLRYETVTWKLDLGTSSTPYTTFLTSLRGKFKTSEVCKFPVTSKSPAKAKQFILVDIIDTLDKTVTLALRASDAYFLGYRDIFEGAPRANFVEDDFDTWKKSDVFSNVIEKNKIKLPFKSSYDSMEKVGELKGENGRKNLQLGITNLNTIIDTVYGKDYKTSSKPKNIGRDLARFGLIVVQMVAEATRFKYIENEIINKGLSDKSFFPDDNIIKLQKEWGKISEAIHISSTDKKPCQNVNKLDFPSNVGTVDGLRPYISLVKFKKGKISESEIGMFEGNSAALEELMEAALM